jgi:uncharacterized protein (DUF302 family)
MTDAAGTATDEGIISKHRVGSVADAVAALTGLIEARGMKVFSIVDHSGDARRIGLDLRDTVLVVFGSPAGGTPIMQAAPLAALDLPLKVLVWDNHGQTTVSYTSPDQLGARHHLSPELEARIAGIGPLTDELVS